MPASFKTIVKAHLTSTKRVQARRQELCQMVYDHALEHDDFDYAAVLLNGLWSIRAYGASKSITDYFRAHMPIHIEFKKGEPQPFSAKARKNKDGTRDPFIDMTTPWNEWEKASVESALTADRLIKIINGAITKSEKLEDQAEVVKFQDFLKTVAKAA